MSLNILLGADLDALAQRLEWGYGTDPTVQMRRLERRARKLHHAAVYDGRVLSDREWNYATSHWPAMKDAEGVRVRREYRRGRYATWLLVFLDERVRNADGAVRWRCRGCPEPAGRGYHCSQDCQRLVDERVWASTEWNAVRARVLRRDGQRCVRCGAGEKWDHAGGRHRAVVWLEVDHIVAVMDDPGQEFDLDNLRVLCNSCHARIGARPGTRPRGLRSHLQGSGASLLDFGGPL